MIRLSKQVNFTDYTFVVPSVSVGNVGQLASDLLITTLNLTKVGTVWHKAIVPAYGSNPFDSTSQDNCLACELYTSETHKLVVLQLRSSIERKHAKAFFNDLKSFIIQEHFKQVIVLTSSFAYEMHDVSSGHYRYVTNTDLREVFERNNILPLERTDTGRMVIHGAGFATNLYEMLVDSVNVTIVVKYTSEGDNRPDAVSMVHVLQQCLPLDEAVLQNIRSPISWDLVYGSPPPIGIY